MLFFQLILGLPHQDGPLNVARFNVPRGIAFDSIGNLFISDCHNFTIRKITPDGMVSTIAGSPGLRGGTDGFGMEARFNENSALAVDSSGFVWVADTWGFTIRRISPEGQVSTIAGLSEVRGSTDGIGSEARFNHPYGIAIDSDGNAIVSDYVNSTIRKVTPEGVVTTVAGSAGVNGTADGPALDSRFSYPIGLAYDSLGNLYIADYWNHTIRKMTPQGIVLTIAGSAGNRGCVEGLAGNALLGEPAGLAVGPDGNIYIADPYCNIFWRMTPEGEVRRLAGQIGVIGNDDGGKDTATFNNPMHLTFDSDGNLFFSDQLNHTIRKISFHPSLVPDKTPPIINTLPSNVSLSVGMNCTIPLPDFINQVIDTDDKTPPEMLLKTQNPQAGTSLRVGLTIVTITVQDQAGNVSTAQISIHVENNPPTASIEEIREITEGSSLFLTGIGNDPEGGPVQFFWDLNNDGIFETAGQTAPFFAVDGSKSQSVLLQTTDSCGDSTITSAMITIQNVPPTVSDITAPIDPLLVNSMVSVSASFTDPGTFDTHTALWNWGDGSSSDGTITESNGNGSTASTHSYTTPGIYRITLTVTDKDGGTDQSWFEYVVVYDPSAGFVTGGGWIVSPAGSYIPDPSLIGKATFGFVSKYQKGKSVPSGETQFKFHAADMDFRSTSYQWMVVAGSKAQYKGEGTINAVGLYGFMLTATDGQQNDGGGTDKFRIKIWNKVDDQIVYDNQMGADDTSDLSTVLGGGSVIVHK